MDREKQHRAWRKEHGRNKMMKNYYPENIKYEERTYAG